MNQTLAKAPCPQCGHELDFTETDELGRTMETCRVCKTRRLLPVNREPPKPNPHRPNASGFLNRRRQR